MEGLLIGQVAVARLADHGGESRAAASVGGSLAHAAFRVQRAESGRRRRLQAVKTLSTCAPSRPESESA